MTLPRSVLIVLIPCTHVLTLQVPLVGAAAVTSLSVGTRCRVTRGLTFQTFRSERLMSDCLGLARVVGKRPMLQPRHCPVSEMRRIALPVLSFPPPSPSGLCSGGPHSACSSLSRKRCLRPRNLLSSCANLFVVKPRANYNGTAAASRRHGHSFLAAHWSCI